MRKHLSRVCAFSVIVCLLCMNTVSAFAAADPTVPAAASVRSEAQATAAYVLSQDDFSDLSDTSKFHHASSDLILAIRSGLDCDTQTETYLNAVKQLLNSDGTLNVPVSDYAYPNDTYVCYAYLLMVLALTHQDAGAFNEFNVISAFNTLLADTRVDDFKFGSDPDTFENTGLNPYYLGIINSAVEAYSGALADYNSISFKIKTALSALSDENGLNYYGYSADNNGTVYPHFSRLYQRDPAVKALIDTAVFHTKGTYFSEEDGTTHTIYTDYVTGETVDEPSIDSTALALALYAQFGQAETAAKSYNALLTFKSASTPGAYDGYDPVYASQDALTGLVTYLRSLDGQTHPYDVSDALNNTNDPNANDSDVISPDTGNEADAADEKISPATADSADALMWTGGMLVACAFFTAAYYRHKHFVSQ